MKIAECEMVTSSIFKMAESGCVIHKRSCSLEFLGSRID